MRILMLDHVSKGTGIHERLIQMGFGVHRVGSSLDALRLLRQDHFDMALLNTQDARLGGLRVLRRITRDHGAIIPIAVSLHMTPRLVTQALSAGAYDCISHSIDPLGLRLVVLRALKRHSMETRARAILQKRADRLSEFSQAGEALLDEIANLKNEIAQLQSQVETRSGMHPLL